MFGHGEPPYDSRPSYRTDRALSSVGSGPTECLDRRDLLYDVSVGSFEFNKYLDYPEFKLMDGLYDATALGNHEFDLGLDVLTDVLAGAPELGCDLGPVTLPALCANVTFPGGSFLASRVVPHIIREFGGIKVGVFGLANYDALNYSSAVYAMLDDPLVAAAAQVAELKAEGCAVVVCLSHLGKAWDVQSLTRV